ncbi:hypothetical protein PRIPAC_80478 [Pristionchus pacificus]|uniref:Uncharacterized protein n=1 Tax=Pristionchus pacificus TaxID=54126 RepID=A0A2A6CN80_PRIPA|nr:hypothetical protein PRIPAC_80478 [Pristionchus pacificus]|eukprot:PDM79569.1 hypothetical protein PRIPAC_32148 [Pristionchus pacificus]
MIHRLACPNSSAMEKVELSLIGSNRVMNFVVILALFVAATHVEGNCNYDLNRYIRGQDTMPVTPVMPCFCHKCDW